ncbi:FCD domain-containing protein [Rhizobium sp. CECT 9324]|uniref:FadR/GntR family transcriptional regulator n=1 Tax=Rhizobium sp. CECT 9324 TaxID=2845820 RepID=UPI0033A2EB88
MGEHFGVAIAMMAGEIHLLLVDRRDYNDTGPAAHGKMGGAACRRVVSDGLVRLRIQGIVYVRFGAGSFVSAQGSSSAPLSYLPVKTIADIQRCCEFRLTIEPAVAYFAAKRRDEAAIQKIAAALDELREATSHQHLLTDADYVFHRAVTEAANHHYYTASLDALKAQSPSSCICPTCPCSVLNSASRRFYKKHNSMYRAIAEGRADDAKSAMLKDLEGSRDRLFQGRALDLSI